MALRFRPTFVFAKMAPKIIALALSLTLALAPTLASAQTSVIATPIPNAKQTFVDSNGKPFSGGKVYNYVPNTTVPKTTWSDTGETTPNSNPVTLDSAGRATIFGQGNYRQVLKDSAGNTIWDSFTIAPGSASPSGATGTDTAPVGTVMPFAGLSIPTNWVLAYGQALSRTTYPDLLTALTIVNSATSCTTSSTTISGLADTSQMRIGAPIEASCLPTGTTIATIVSSTSVTVNNSATSTGTVTSTVFPWGDGDGSLTFNVPDLRGRAVAGADAMGGTAASRLTSTYFGSNAGAPGQAGGSQSHTLTAAESAVLAYTASAPTVSGQYQNATSHVLFGSLAAGADEFFVAPNSTDSIIGASASAPTVSSNAGGAAHAIVQPTLTFNYIIKVAPNTSGAGGVVSIGGMFGDVLCGTGITCAAQTISNSGVLNVGGLTGSITCGGGLTCSAGTITVTGFPTGVTSFNGRFGGVLPQSGDYTFSQISGTATAAQLAAGAASTNVGALSGDLSGTLPGPSVVGLRGTQIGSAAPANGQTIVYDSSSGHYNPTYLTISMDQYVPTPSANDTIGAQSALSACTGYGGCMLVCPKLVTYTVDTLTVGSNTKLVSCKFQQRTQGTPVLDLNGVTNVHIDDCNITGKVVPPQAAAIGNDWGIKIEGNSDHVWVRGCYITLFGAQAVWAQQSTNVFYLGNHFYQNFDGVWFRGVNGGTVANNIIEHTSAYSLTPTLSQLTSAITFEGTDGQPYGISTRFAVTGNVIKDFPYSQAVFGHAGQWITVTGNQFYNVSAAVSFNPFNLTDTMENITVSGNAIEGTQAASLPPSAPSDAGIAINGCGAVPIINGVTVANNTIHAVNRVVPGIGSGGIILGCTNNTSVTGNSLFAVGVNGIVLRDNEEGATVVGNSVYSVVPDGSGNANGILNEASPRAIMSGNMFSELATASAVGIKTVGSTVNLALGTNNYYNVTQQISPGPAISAGFCSGAIVSAANQFSAFNIGVGTTCAGSTGTLSMPDSQHGYSCSFANVTNPAANVVSQTGGSTNTVTLTNYSRTTGAATNFTDSDVIRATCTQY